ncbi:MAG: hypothetical protein JO052_07565 [Bradyrhizobium sp.]|nr:hypothetical protein [Bradyrhizobium sp.]
MIGVKNDEPAFAAFWEDGMRRFGVAFAVLPAVISQAAAASLLTQSPSDDSLLALPKRRQHGPHYSRQASGVSRSARPERTSFSHDRFDAPVMLDVHPSKADSSKRAKKASVRSSRLVNLRSE